ncbi:amino acid ABC transporter substrate-binding protein [Haloimpatiens sp. FM7315]|uniref:amino acid ABC transporter substrate-binding protein n=1 Tax=Haloimpatiens sp. FM7315 TaxID=3298609 RepID=UPI0035A3C7D1
MKKISCILSVTLILSTLLLGCGSTKEKVNSMEAIKEKGKFVVGLDDSFPPMGFRDDNGEIAGFDIDLAKEVAKRIGVKVEFKSVDWDGVVLSLKNKDIDVIWNGLTITDERKEKIGFSKAYLKNRQIIMVNKNSVIESKMDLSKKSIGVQMGSSSEEALNSEKDVVSSLKDVKKYSNNTEALLDLKAGRIDAVVIDEVVGRYYMTKKPLTYEVLEDNFGEEEYGVGYRKEDKEFGEAIDKALDEMKKDGTMDEIYKRWFKEK